MTKQPKPQTFPTEGPRSMQFTAYDPNRFDVCSDPDCDCRSRIILGHGSTEAEAIADYWEQWEEKYVEPPVSPFETTPYEEFLERVYPDRLDSRANTR